MQKGQGGGCGGMPVILACGRWGQEDQEFEANISYTRLSPTPIPQKKGQVGKAKAKKGRRMQGLFEEMLPGGRGWQKGKVAGFKDKGWVVVTWGCVFSENCCYSQG